MDRQHTSYDVVLFAFVAELRRATGGHFGLCCVLECFMYISIACVRRSIKQNARVSARGAGSFAENDSPGVKQISEKRRASQKC